MQKYLKSFVNEDTTEAWAKVKAQMPWNFKTEGSEQLAVLQFSDCDTDVSNAEAIEELISESPKGTIWAPSIWIPTSRLVMTSIHTFAAASR